MRRRGGEGVENCLVFGQHYVYIVSYIEIVLLYKCFLLFQQSSDKFIHVHYNDTVKCSVHCSTCTMYINVKTFSNATFIYI